jgi:hypothetical protein
MEPRPQGRGLLHERRPAGSVADLNVTRIGRVRIELACASASAIVAAMQQTIMQTLRAADEVLAKDVVALVSAAADHRVFDRIRTAEHVRTFMEHHVWAVWDFMSLLKSIQSSLAPASVPWCPPDDPEVTRLVNELVLGEESDEGPSGAFASHFELYLSAMDTAGADSRSMRAFLAAIAAGAKVSYALSASGAPRAAKDFVEFTLAVCSGPLGDRIAAFAIGREEIIPATFHNLVERLPQGGRDADFSLLRYYLERHIHVDGERHGPMSLRLLERYCLAEPPKRRSALDACRIALRCRIALWDAVDAAIA